MGKILMAYLFAEQFLWYFPLLLVQIHWYNNHHVANSEAHSWVEESVVKFKQHSQRERDERWIPNYQLCCENEQNSNSVKGFGKRRY